MKKWQTNLLIWSIACALILSIVPLDVTHAASESADSTVMIFKRIQPNSNSINIGNKLVNNELYVNSIWPTYTFTDSLTWKEDPYNDRTWCFYFHSLDMVGYLMNAYEKNPSQAYLEKAKWYIESWMAANPSPDNQASPSAWDDHSTANRVVNIIYFWTYYKNSSIYDPVFGSSLMAMLELHGDFLANDSNYRAESNQGIFEDRSLLELSLLFPEMKNSQAWYKKAMDRLVIHISNDVTQSGVHKEHSPSYLMVTLNLFKSIQDFMNQFGVRNEELTNTIKKMEDYVAYLLQPDGTLPLLGDSVLTSLRSLKVNTITSDKLKYVISNGKQGIKPINDAYYADGGVAIFRKMWNVDTPFYFLFTAAFHSNIHKHADDLSFLLTYGKTDFFVDSGRYNYNETDAYRQYFRSTMAHNTITVDGKSYPLTKNQVNKSRIDRYKTASTYSYVMGSHSLYEGVTIQRTAIYLKNINSILIHDVISSENDHTYSELFNIGKDVQVTSADNKTFALKSTIENKEIEFKHLTKASSFTQYHGSENPIAGWQSLNVNEKLPITQLQFTNEHTKEMTSNFVINTNAKAGVQSYHVKSGPTYDLYTITYKNGKTGEY